MPRKPVRLAAPALLALAWALACGPARAEEAPPASPPPAPGATLAPEERSDGYVSQVTKSGARPVTEAFAEAERVWELRESPEKAREAAALFEKIVRSDPDVTDGWLRLAEARWWLGELEEDPESGAAVGAYRACLDAAERAIALDKFESRAFYWSARCGNEYREARGLLASAWRLNGVLRRLREAEKMDPDLMQGGLYALRAEIVLHATPPARLFMNDGPKDALRLLERQQEIAQGCFAARVLHGDVLLALGRPKDARAQWEYVIRTPPDRIPECYHDNLRVQDRLRRDIERARRSKK